MTIFPRRRVNFTENAANRRNAVRLVLCNEIGKSFYENVNMLSGIMFYIYSVCVCVCFVENISGKSFDARSKEEKRVRHRFVRLCDVIAFVLCAFYFVSSYEFGLEYLLKKYFESIIIQFSIESHR